MQTQDSSKKQSRKATEEATVADESNSIELSYSSQQSQVSLDMEQLEELRKAVKTQIIVPLEDEDITTYADQYVAENDDVDSSFGVGEPIEEIVDPEASSYAEEFEEIGNEEDSSAAPAKSSTPPTKKASFNQIPDLNHSRDQPDNEDLIYDLVSTLKSDIISMKGNVSEYQKMIDQIRAHESRMQKELYSLRHSASQSIEQSTRVLLDRQKKAYQILVGKLRREVRRLKFQKNSVSDPLLEQKFFPYLPRTPYGVSAKSQLSEQLETYHFEQATILH